MCYSAQIRSQYKKFVRTHGAVMDLKAFIKLFWERNAGPGIKIPKSVEADFDNPENDDEQHIKAAVDQYKIDQAAKIEQELFAQTKRKADAERKLQTKITKAAQNDFRIATNKIAKAKDWLSDLRRSELEPKDSRIFPGWYVPVIVMEDGKRVVKPMRYQCRPGGKPAFYDTKFPGTYNARRDNLEGFWKDLFGYAHGIMVADSFFENVSKHKVEGRELAPDEKDENAILEFRPSDGKEMLVACLWSRWVGPDGEELLSFAAITDEPPPEVAAAGHDRCIIPIKEQNIDAWLNPDPANLAAQYAILDDRKRPFYEHRMAA